MTPETPAAPAPRLDRAELRHELANIANWALAGWQATDTAGSDAELADTLDGVLGGVRRAAGRLAEAAGKGAADSSRALPGLTPAPGATGKPVLRPTAARSVDRADL